VFPVKKKKKKKKKEKKRKRKKNPSGANILVVKKMLSPLQKRIFTN